MASLIFGVCSTGLFGYGAYSCFNNFSKELEKTTKLRKEMEKSVTNFSDRSCLISQGIVSLPLSKPQYYYSISKLSFVKDLELRRYSNHNLYTGETTRVIVPVEVENTIKKHVDEFLSDPTFGNVCLPSSSLKYFFSTPPSKAQCDGSYLSNLLQERHGIRTMYGGNRDVFELKTTAINSRVFLLGENIGEQFSYSAISDNKEDLINKVVSENDSSGDYFLGGMLCAGGFIVSLVATVAELGKQN